MLNNHTVIAVFKHKVSFLVTGGAHFKLTHVNLNCVACVHHSDSVIQPNRGSGSVITADIQTAECWNRNMCVGECLCNEIVFFLSDIGLDID